MDNWQKIYSDTSEYRSEIVRAVLDDREMKPVLVNKKDSSYQLGHFEILVSPDHVIKALKIINEEIKFE